MAQSNKALFHWNRLNHNDVKRKKGSSSINDWIKKVQHESEIAVQEALGDEIPELGFNDFIPDDEAVYEAQELVNCWAKETSLNNIENELKYRDECWNSTANSSNYRSTLHSTYDNGSHALDEMKSKYFKDLDDEVTNQSNRNIEKNFETDDFSSLSLNSYTSIIQLNNQDSIDGIDETLLVQDVLQGMLSKDFQKNIDLDLKPLSKKATNPVPKMDVRHEQVKIRGEKRRKKNLEKKKEKLSKEDIIQRAKERVINEERKRIEREKAEEKAIISEMEKIKLQLAEEKREKEREMKEKERILNEAKLKMQIELKEAREQEILKRKEEKEIKKQIEKQLQKEALHELQFRMKILHKHFAAWYDLILQQRLKLGKALAVADWKCKVRAWNAWRAYVCCIKANQEARAIEEEMKEKYRKEQLATNHANKMMLCKCFIGWKKYTRYKTEKALLKLEREETSKKIALFLEAASTGSLWSAESENENSDKHCDKKKLIKDQNIGRNDDNIDKGRKEEIKNKEEINIYNREINKDVNKNKMKEIKEEKIVEKSEIVHEEIKVSTKSTPIKRNKSKIISMQAVNNDSSVDYVPSKQPVGRTDGIKISSKRDTIKRITTSANIKEENKGISVPMPIKKDKADAKPSTSVLNTDRSESSSVASEISTTSSKQRVSSGKQTTKPLHLAMEEREKERQAKRAIIQEEKRKKEEEKLALLKLKEAERLKQEQLEKEEQIRVRKEQKKLELQKQKEKELQIEQNKLKNIVAKEHYHKVILKKFGFAPLKDLVKIAKLNIQISDRYHHANLSRCCLLEWHLYTKEISSAKKRKAEECYEKILKKRTFNSWLKCRFYLQNMDKIARTFSIQRTLKYAFGAWQEYVTDERILMWAKESTAEEHDTERIRKCYFKAWKSYVILEKEERKREKRKEELRKKVQGWLPDYQGDTGKND